MSATEAAPESGGDGSRSPARQQHINHATTSTNGPALHGDDDHGETPIPNGDGSGDGEAGADVKMEDDEEATQLNEGDDNATATTLRPDPLPSIKRRESEGADQQPQFSERPTSKKRKRGASPPWQFPTADTTTLKSADGRRISARVNTATPGVSDNDAARARSSSLSQPPANPLAPGSAPRSRESPPWKKFEAAGPTSMVVDGKRKSGRVNRELGDTPKRVSPRSAKKQDVRPASSGKTATNSHVIERKLSMSQTQSSSKTRESGRPSESTDSDTKIAELRARIEALQPSRSFSSPEQTKRSHKRKSNDEDVFTAPKSPKASRPLKQTLSPEVHRPSPKIKLRFNGPRRVVPPPHPNAQPPLPVRPPRPSVFHAIEDFELQELQQPHTENERGPPDMAWFLQRNERQAIEEAAMRKKILREARPGGILSKERLSIYQDADPQPEPPKQYGHHDHLVAHALHLRHLQLREKAAHRQLAKKVANEALELWKKKRGPTEEDLREEADRMFRLIYKQVVFDVKAKWDLVAQHVQQRRLREWEEQEEAKRQEKLRKQLEKSEHMLARQKSGLQALSEDEGDEDEGSDEDADESESGEENMSDSSEEEEEKEGEEEDGGGEMGDDELAAYLAQRKAEPPDRPSEDAEMADTSLAEMPDERETPAEANQTENERAEHDQDEDDVSMADATEKQQGKPIDVQDTMDALFADDAVDDDEDATEEEFQPDNDESEAVEHEQSDNERVSVRRSRRSSQSPVDAGDEEGEFSSDESTDMDSTDYDSDEDMSSTGEEDNAADDADEEEGASGDEQPLPKNSLLSLFKDEVKNMAGLPTPTTSAEGDEREHAVEEQADANTGAEDVSMLDAVDEQSRQDSIQDTTKQEAAEALHSARPSAEPETSVDAPSNNLVSHPALLRGTLRSYQHAGLDWLATLYRQGTNGILADEMGLGKTIQTISLLAHLAERHEVWEPHLVIVPTSVVLNWVTEFQKFLPGFRVLAYYGPSEERQVKRRRWVNDPHHVEKDKRGYNVIVTSYNIAMQDINAIRNVKWHYLVLDEAHNIRNFQSNKWQTLIRLKTKARLLLTGTPLQNSLTELWSLLTFLTALDDDPAHGDLEEFLSHWKEPVNDIFNRGVSTLSTESQRVVDQLHVSLRPFLLRRLKSEVEKQLPKKTEEVVVCKLSKRQRQLYQEYMGLAETKRSLAHGNAVSAGKVLLSLRRVCNHPDLFDPRPIETSWAMEGSVPLEFEGTEDIVRKMLGVREEVPHCFRLAAKERLRSSKVKRSQRLHASAKLEAERKSLEASNASDAKADPGTLAGCMALRRVQERREKLDHLRSSIDISKESLQVVPMYGSDLRELVTIKSGRCYRVPVRDIRGRIIGKALRGWPELGRHPLRFENDHPSDWALSKTSMLQRSVQTAERYADTLRDTIARFAFVTPVVTAPVLNQALPPRTQQVLRASPSYPLQPDYAHESRTRTAIAFPDSRLLIYDSGKLQRLTHLLRQLQFENSRSLIFTQMTGTLNILEQFLNLLNLPYLRLDGSTPVERRQLYAAEFNRPDSKYQCMILSSRAGGIGLNLTGASSVIFYDLDWNPQMDRQCMDRAHRIGQVRDVRVFKMVSEKTVEENILRRAQQKSLLDQTVIQEGHFTTDYEMPKAAHEAEGEGDEDVAAAIDRFLGDGNDGKGTQALESVEDADDVAAAHNARKEEHQDDVDFADRSSKGPSRAQTPGDTLGEPGGVEGEEERQGHVDLYMIRQMERLLEGVKFVPPQPVKRDRKGRDRGRKRGMGRHSVVSIGGIVS
ncbi:swr1 complex component [Saxophila tyrrhenica]|uniref:DNA helicase n=1 Tax=Saxophila tyrrhenica TaxID=1690608 RepID=A0AAV9PFS2_9PEZI|nr:swr1 complex component [Saxophila tyrrhenica]